MNESSGAGMPGSDAELLNAIRSGDPGPYDLLRARHAVAARRLAGHLAVDQATAADVVARAFAQVLEAISRGGGPTDAFRPYLLTAVRRAAHDEASAGAQIPIDEQRIPDPGQLPSDQETAGLAGSPIVAAFLSLPERWRAVLWHTAVEGATPAEAARVLGLPEAGAVELADQARDGLARAYRPPGRAAVGHADDAADDDANAGADAASAALRSTLAPLVLGEAAAAYLAGLAGSANSAGTRPAASSGAGSGTAAGRLSDKLRDSSPRQRTVAAGAGALLAMVAIGGYALTLSPVPGGVSKASGHEAPVGVTSRSGSPTPGSSAPASSAPASSAPASSAPASSGPAPTAAPSSARATAPAASGNGRRSSRRPPAASTPGTSPTSARPLLAAPGPALSPPASSPPPVPASSPPPVAAGSWLPSDQVAALGPAALSHGAEVNLGAAASRLFRLVITGSASCGRAVHVTATAGAPSAAAPPAAMIACGWSPESGAATDSRQHEPGSRSAATATSTDAGPNSSAGTNSAANSSPEPGSRTGAVGGWHRDGRPPVTWQRPGAPWSGSQWPTKQWPGNQWPTR